MMEKKIKSYGQRKDIVIRFVKEDHAKLGKVYVLYPDELDELQDEIKDLELEIAILNSKNSDLKEQLNHNSDNVDVTNLINRLDTIEERLDKLELHVTKW